MSREQLNWVVALLALLYAGVLWFYADVQVTSGLDMDRYAFMESLVEHGSLTVEPSHYESIDRIRINGHFYSGKPPVLNFMGAAVYYVMFKGMGWSFANHESQVVRALIAVFVSLPAAYLLLQFWLVVSRTYNAVSRRVEESAGSKTLQFACAATALLAFGSLLAPYCRVFTNHVFAAALLMPAFSLALRSWFSSTSWRWAAVGFLAALSATIDLLPGSMLLAGLGLYILVVFIFEQNARMILFRHAVAMCLGAAMPLAAHVALNRLTLGTWNTSYLVKDAFNYPGSAWTGQIKDADIFPTFPAALYHYVFGHRGSVWLLPLLFVGAIVAIRVAFNRGEEPAARATAFASVFSLCATLILVPAYSMGLAGSSYSNRHLVPLNAILYAYLPTAFVYLQTSGVFTRVLVSLLCVYSVVVSAIGVAAPWTPYRMSVYAPLDVITVPLARYGDPRIVKWIIEHTAMDTRAAYEQVGMHVWQDGRSREALQHYLTALDYAGATPKTYYFAGVLANIEGDKQLSIKMLRKSVEIAPGFARAWAQLGNTLADIDPEGALKAYQQSLDLQPGNDLAVAGVSKLKAKASDGQLSGTLTSRAYDSATTTTGAK